MLTQERLRDLFQYDTETGCLLWRKPPHARLREGQVAGTITPSGYWQVGIDYRCYGAHRLIWVFHFGPIPEGLMIDHIDRNPSNNCLPNLRLVNSQKNSTNRGKASRNTTGVNGVYFNKALNNWYAKIKVHRRNIHLGIFQTREEAAAARKRADLEYGFAPNHGLPI